MSVFEPTFPIAAAALLHVCARFGTTIRQKHLGARRFWAQPRAGLKPRAGLSPPSFEVDGLIAARGHSLNP